uniref:Putative mitotic checkpoint protein prcc n=1 Tax=Anopheles darlingi TaxID=43151 RepID=A0A2M4CRR8_ANODA
MSLVSYDYSSAEESEDEQTEQEPRPIPSGTSQTTSEPPKATVDSDVLQDVAANPLLPLPAPKQATNNELDEEEEDDEFLHKKAIPADVPLPTPPPPPPKELSALKAKLRNGKVQITVPSMKDFEDDEAGSAAKKSKVTIGAALPKAATSLLNLLPKPRTALFAPSSSKPATAATGSSTAEAAGPSFLKRLVPDSVANRPRSVPASVTKQTPTRPVDQLPASGSQKLPKAESSEDEDDGDNDFFSFNKVDALPTVSANEITAMVAKKAAKIAETVRKYTEPEPSPEEDYAAQQSTMNQQPPSAATDSQDLANENALAALIGGNRAKRGRVEQVDLIEITSADIVPSKEDFLRRQLQDETGYVPTGHLVGDWKCTSKKKSHITQLASKAQANAQELEAMWASNRQSRRQTQSKYGF